PFAYLSSLRFPIFPLSRRALAFFFRAERCIHRPKGGEECLDAIVIGLLDWIEFVVVAASATERDAQKRRCRRIGDVVERLLPALFAIDRVEFVRVMPQEASRDQCVVVIWIKFISSQLFFEESIVWLVGVERADDIIAITPSIGSGVVGLETVA